MAGEIDPNLKIEVAAQDSYLRAIFELQIFGVTMAVNESRADIIEMYSDEEVIQLRRDIMRDYGLSERDMQRVIGRCVADVAGIGVGLSQ